jgi:hypothetical protein
VLHPISIPRPFLLVSTTSHLTSPHTPSPIQSKHMTSTSQFKVAQAPLSADTEPSKTIHVQGLFLLQPISFHAQSTSSAYINPILLPPGPTKQTSASTYIMQSFAVMSRCEHLFPHCAARYSKKTFGPMAMFVCLCQLSSQQGYGENQVYLVVTESFLES